MPDLPTCTKSQALDHSACTIFLDSKTNMPTPFLFATFVSHDHNYNTYTYLCNPQINKPKSQHCQSLITYKPRHWILMVRSRALWLQPEAESTLGPKGSDARWSQCGLEPATFAGCRFVIRTERRGSMKPVRFEALWLLMEVESTLKPKVESTSEPRGGEA